MPRWSRPIAPCSSRTARRRSGPRRRCPPLRAPRLRRLLSIAADKVDVQVQLLGGGFGRRLEVDFISQAAAIAREGEGRPVQTIWSREQDMTHDFLPPGLRLAFQSRPRRGRQPHRVAQQFRWPVDHPAGVAAQLRLSRRGVPTRRHRKGPSTSRMNGRTRASGMRWSICQCRWVSGVRWVTRIRRSSKRALSTK